jgi:hypothetical protein
LSRTRPSEGLSPSSEPTALVCPAAERATALISAVPFFAVKLRPLPLISSCTASVGLSPETLSTIAWIETMSAPPSVSFQSVAVYAGLELPSRYSSNTRWLNSFAMRPPCEDFSRRCSG